MVFINVQDANKKLEQAFAQLKPQQVATAMARAINRTLGKGRTTVKRNIKGKYNIKEPDMAQALKVWNANKNHLQGSINASPKPISLSHFDPVVSFKSGGAKQVQLKRKKNKATGKYEIIGRSKKATGNDKLGASFSVIKGQTKNLPYAFIIKGSSNKPLFARGAYGPGGFVQRHQRKNAKGSDTPLAKLLTTSVFASTQNEDVQKPTMVDLTADYEARLLHEINYLTSKIS